jgi:capsular exopolysaccharide synthesis family protein
MSHIFDGLQRSEIECSDADLATLSGVTELLQHAERRATSKWETARSSEPFDNANGTESPSSFDLKEISQIEALHAAPGVVTEPLLCTENATLFDQFASLQMSPPSQSRLPCLTDSGSAAAEAFRLLAVRLHHLRRDRPLKKVLITSTIPQEGKSTVAANLSCTLSLRRQQRILLLEGDLRRPSLSQIFGLRKNIGLSECLRSVCNLTASIYRLDGTDVWILPAGNAPGNALELLQSGRLSTLMDQLTALFDWIVIDSPPVLPLADTSVWMRLTDVILLTTRQGITEKRKLQRGLDAIESDKLVGAIVNSSMSTTANDYYYYSTVASGPRNDSSQ